AKADITAEQASDARTEARTRLLTVLEQALRLLHPFMPYITEELWQRLPGDKRLHQAYEGAEPTVMLTAYPEGAANLIDEAAESEMQAIIELISRTQPRTALISRVRTIRSEMNIKPGERIPIVVAATEENLRQVFSAAREQ